MSNPPVTRASTEGDHERRIRSFARRSGRLRPGQKAALENLWSVHGIDFQSTPLDAQVLLGGHDALKVEIGFGNGYSLLEMAANDPDNQYLGIEVHRPGIGNCLKQIDARGIDNLKLVQHDAVEVLRDMLPAESVERVFLFFPDPWHKKRHHKRRIVNQLFRDLVHRVLVPKGVLHMATDWHEYAEYMAAEMFSDDRFANQGNAEGYADQPDYRPTTKFERRGQRLGHGVWDLLFSRHP